MNDRTPRNSLDAKHQLHWYQIERVLGQGGFGITYLAYDSNLDQLVAIKEYLPMELAIRDGDNSVYPASGAMGERYDWGLERFLVEARTLAKFRHPAIVRVLSVFEANNTAYMVMEYESGESLQDIVSRQKTLSEEEIVRLIPPILDGLEVIHAEGFIHRDIKPANLFIREDGTPVLLDFGSARQALGEQTKTLTSVVSPGYAPFEQYYSKSDRQGPWTDIYGFGATLYRCVTGRQPMDAIDRSEAILKAERDIFVSASEIGADRYSATLLGAVDHAMQFREKSRPQSIAEWRLDFGLPQPSGTLSEPFSLPAERAQQTAFGEEDHASIDLSTGEAFADSKAATLPEHTVVATAPPAAPASAPVSAAPAGERRWLWPSMVAVLLVALAAAVFYGGLGGDALRSVFDGGTGGDQPRTAEELLRAQQLEQRLAQAAQALKDDRLLEPPLANALDLYRDVLRMDPGNAEATEGIGNTALAVLGRARSAAENNDFDDAYSLIATALVIQPDLEGVEDLREYIGQQKARAGARQQADERLSKLLAAGRDDLAAGRLAGSGTDNALARFRTVLVLDPDNAEASAGITAVLEGLAAEGGQLLADGNLAEANRILADLNGIDAGHPATAAFAERYEAAAAEADAAKQQDTRIAELLRAGDAALRANRLTSPAGNNALEKYRAVLKLAPDNNRALAGVDAVVDKYAWLAEQAAIDGDGEQAERFLAKARGIAPGSARVRALEERLAADAERAAEEARKAEEAAALAEQERRQAEALAAAEADAERKRRQEEEALRLLREAEEAAGIERARRDAEADARIRRVAIRYDGFETEYERYGLKVSTLRKEFTEQLSNAGYRLLSYDEAVRDPKARLVLVYFRANLNTTTGMFSYATAIRLNERLPLRESSDKAFSSRPVWSKGDNGALRQSDLGRLNAVYRDLMTAFVRDNPGRN